MKKAANIDTMILKVFLGFLFMVALIIGLGVDATRNYRVEPSAKEPATVYIGAMYLYSSYIDTLNPFHTVSYDTVTVIDTCRGYVLFNVAWLGEQSSTIGHFAAHSKLYKINGGYLP